MKFQLTCRETKYYSLPDGGIMPESEEKLPLVLSFNKKSITVDYWDYAIRDERPFGLRKLKVPGPFTVEHRHYIDNSGKLCRIVEFRGKQVWDNNKQDYEKVQIDFWPDHGRGFIDVYLYKPDRHYPRLVKTMSDIWLSIKEFEEIYELQI